MNIKSLSAPGIEQLQEWGPKLLSALLVVCIAYMLTQLIWYITGNNRVPAAATPELAPKVNSRQKQSDRYADTIASVHLFGQSDVVPGNDEIVAPETTLNLQLLGILAIGDKDGLAIIAGGGREEQVYKVGDKIPGNVTLKTVYADRVLLESSRGLETLPLPKEANLFKFVDSPTGEDQAGGKQAYEPESGSTPEISPQVLNEYRRNLSRNPAEIQKMAKVSPAMEDGKVIGYKLEPGANSAMYNALGLKPGDVVTELNGIDLTKPENSIRALQHLRRAKSIDATIVRDGQEIHISHSLSE